MSHVLKQHAAAAYAAAAEASPSVERVGAARSSHNYDMIVFKDMGRS